MYRNINLKDLIIATLLSAKNSYTFHKILKEREFENFKKESIRLGIYRLKKKGFIKCENSEFSLTKEGKDFYKNKNPLSYITSPFNKNSKNNLIISFDIPERDRKIRRWLRNQLKIFNYKMLQQSLWIGPGPLPKEFLKRLDKLQIRKNIKTFNIKTN